MSSVGLVVGIPVLCCSSEAKYFLEFAVGDGGEERLAAASANTCVSFVSIVDYRSVLGMKENESSRCPPAPRAE